MPRPKKGERIAGSGRKKGVPNKLTTSMREAWRAAFDELGGIKALVVWGRENPSDFYRAITKMIPQDITSGDQPLQTALLPAAERDARIAALLGLTVTTETPFGPSANARPD